MTPVDQTVFGWKFGNCHAACVASILELPIWRVPNVGTKPDWTERLAFWLRRHGFGHLTVATPSASDHEIRRAFTGHFMIASGPTERATKHGVVYRGFDELVHDPHPSRAGLERVDDYTLITISDPKKAQAFLARAASQFVAGGMR